MCCYSKSDGSGYTAGGCLAAGDAAQDNMTRRSWYTRAYNMVRGCYSCESYIQRKIDSTYY